jgi:hypothetical protein
MLVMGYSRNHQGRYLLNEENKELAVKFQTLTRERL